MRQEKTRGSEPSQGEEGTTTHSLLRPSTLSRGLRRFGVPRAREGRFEYINTLFDEHRQRVSRRFLGVGRRADGRYGAGAGAPYHATVKGICLSRREDDSREGDGELSDYWDIPGHDLYADRTPLFSHRIPKSHSRTNA